MRLRNGKLLNKSNTINNMSEENYIIKKPIDNKLDNELDVLMQDALDKIHAIKKNDILMLDDTNFITKMKNLLTSFDNILIEHTKSGVKSGVESAVELFVNRIRVITEIYSTVDYYYNYLEVLPQFQKFIQVSKDKSYDLIVDIGNFITVPEKWEKITDKDKKATMDLIKILKCFYKRT